MDTSGLITTLIVGLVGAGGGGGVVGAVLRRGGDKADATVRLTDAAMKQVDQLQERVQESEKERREVDQQWRELRAQMVDLAETMRLWSLWVHTPGMDMDRLKTLIPAPGGGKR